MRLFIIISIISSISFVVSGQESDLVVDENTLLFRDFSVNNQFDFSTIRTSLLFLPEEEPQESVLRVSQPQLSLSQAPNAFFCRIEDAIAKTSKINMKFRLGSVQYVDALEGKGYFEALSYSKATNFHMSRQKKD